MNLRKYVSLFAVIISMCTYAQSFNYQGVARDASGAPIANQNLDVRFAISPTPSGPFVFGGYTEDHNLSTDERGLFTARIGEGTPVLSPFNVAFVELDWANEDFELTIFLDTGSGYQNMGVQPIVEVPLAIHAQKADTSEYANTSNYASTAGSTNNCYYASNATFAISSDFADSAGVCGNAWSLSGNSGTSSAQNFIGTTDASDLVFRTDGKEEMRLERFGFLGLGTNNAFRRLHVNDSTNSTLFGLAYLQQHGTGDAFLHLGLGDNGTHYHMGIDNSDDDKFKISHSLGLDALNNNTLFTLTSSGDLGLGTSTPSAGLEIASSDATAALSSTGGGNSSLYFNNSVNGTFQDWAITHANISSEWVLALGRHETNSGNIPSFVFAAGEFRPNSINGSLGLGNSTFRWSDVWAFNGTIQTSDEREKKNIQNMNYGLAEVMQLRPVTYEWKEREGDGTKLGLIAQELQQVLPETVRDWDWETNSETGERTKVQADRMGVYYSDLIPVLIKAVQEQQEEIDQLRKLLEKR